MTDLEQFVDTNKIRFSADWISQRPDGLMNDSAHHYKCRLMCGRRGYTLYFSQGSAHTSEPSVFDVLDCLASDASGYENARSFEEWAEEYGYDTDSRSAEKIWKAVKRGSEQLKRTVGKEAYNQLLWNMERL